MNEEIAARLGELLRQQHLNLVTVESCTGGLIGDLLTNIPGSSDYYLGGFITYANEMKISLVGVQAHTLQTYGAVSRETALEMAIGGRQAACDILKSPQVLAVSVTGVAGPGGGTPTKPVGLVWIGLSTPTGDFAYPYQWQGNRIENKQHSARQALQIVYDYLKF